MLRHAALAALLLAGSLGVGVLGYAYLDHLPWIDAFVNASMILGGMGPVAELTTDAGKVFASLYALYSGIVLIASAGLLLSPVLHRILHRFHVESEGDDDAQHS